MQKITNILYTICCAVLLTGCVFGNKKTTGPVKPLNPGIHEKVLLKIQGPASTEKLKLFADKLTQLPYVQDVSMTSSTGAVMVCLVPGTTYDIKHLQKAAADAGYTILKAGKIVW
jgi:hypothetical protein